MFRSIISCVLGDAMKHTGFIALLMYCCYYHGLFIHDEHGDDSHVEKKLEKPVEQVDDEAHEDEQVDEEDGYEEMESNDADIDEQNGRDGDEEEGYEAVVVGATAPEQQQSNAVDALLQRYEPGTVIEGVRITKVESNEGEEKEISTNTPAPKEQAAVAVDPVVNNFVQFAAKHSDRFPSGVPKKLLQNL